MSADYLPDLIRSTYNSWELAAAYLVILIMSVFLLYPYFMEKKIQSTNLLKSESGDITITIAALSNLIKDRINEREKFEDLKIKLDESEKGLKIILSGKLTVPGDLPTISEKIQKDLKNYINQTTGIQVAKVQIQIEGVKREKNLPDKTE
jgi:uncharacterized alkaline shock family protein YloU